ncbi:WD40 repeat domain-containing serine/threonine protein kinase [Parafrankia sp. FMc2]|uniref:WD40 repeat domain-containing serine/threonine protein kinase n=1 Tax=Parafrankia sp. FMc2 TaxID=3233196 RepID=UPI0034D459A6
MLVDRRRVEKALPGYRVGEWLGSGQFGLVLAARHRRLRRPVAVKVMEAKDPDGQTGNPSTEGQTDNSAATEQTDDSAAEGRILATLDHPHVVRIFEYVEAQGLCLVVMELLAGGTLTHRRATLTSPQACAVGLAVAAALEHAHTRGVLHRDIKADNILFAADDTVKVTDFGIAKIFDGSAASASNRAGTPTYMAPEQITGGRLSPATDLYALGIVLYQLLAGAPPFDPRQPLQTLWHQHLNDPPPPLHGVPTDLAAVVLRALAKMPADRQPSAAAFARDLARAATHAYGAGWTTRTGIPLHLDDTLRRVIDHQPPTTAHAEEKEQARVEGDHGEIPFLPTWDLPPEARGLTGSRYPAPPRRRNWSRITRPRGVGASVAAAILAVSLLSWRLLPTGTPPSAETISLRLATEATGIAADQTALARRLAVAAYRTAPTPQARTAVLRLLTTEQPAATLVGPTGPSGDVTFSPDGTLLATSNGDLAALVWDATARGEVRPRATLTGLASLIGNMVFSPDGTLLAITSGDQTARVWDIAAQGEVRPRATLTGRALDVVFSPDGTLLATRGSELQTTRIWDATAQGEAQPRAALTGPPGWIVADVWDAAFSPDGTLLATNSWDGTTVQMWDATARGEVQPRVTLTSPTTRGTTDRTVSPGSNSVVFSPDGTLLATSGVDGVVQVWDATARSGARPLATLTGHTRDVQNVVFSPDGTLLATASLDGTARLWDATIHGEARPLATLTGHIGNVQDVVFSPDGTLLATSSDDGTTRMWDVAARGEVRPLVTLPGHVGPTRGVAFSPDGTLLATASPDTTAKLWDVNAGRLAAAACARETDRLTEAEWKAALPKIPYSPPCP